MPNGTYGSEQERFAALNGLHETLILFTATSIGTGVTVTGPTIDISKASSQTIFVDITGAAATGVVCTLRAGDNSFGFTTLRVLTGSGGTPGRYIWKAGTLTSGMSAETTGTTRFNHMFLQVANPASVTGGGVVTVKAIALTSPEF